MPSFSAITPEVMLPIGQEPSCLAPSVPCIGLRCPVCKEDLTTVGYHMLGQPHADIRCRECQASLVQQQGIWMALPEERQRYYESFIRDYEAVRKAEGRGSNHPEFYLSLPDADRTGRNSWQWEIRAQTFRYIERKILPGIAGGGGRPLSILDLGGGNGWMSYRLAKLGHRPIAVDLCTNAFDGLGAAVHYRQVLPALFPRFQAELDHLPFRSEQFDCAIFNASFHYSEDYDHTLAETIRCLRPGGTVVIADSPSYRRDESGQQMLAERRKMFARQFGTTSESLSSREYLTRDRLLALEARHNVEWERHQVWYGFRWACRPLVAALRRRREPSQFRIYTTRVGAP